MCPSFPIAKNYLTELNKSTNKESLIQTTHSRNQRTAHRQTVRVSTLVKSIRQFDQDL